MVKQTIKINNEVGLHLRPAGVLAKIAGELNSDITLIKGEQKANAKSLLNIMAIQVNSGDEIIVQCEGDTEESDLKVIIDAIKSGLGE